MCLLDPYELNPNWDVVETAGKTGRELDGQIYNEFPKRHQAPVPNLESRRITLEKLEAELV